MAKKKKRRPTSSGRSGGTATATKRPGTKTAEMPAVKPAPAQAGGPNRLARKEEARRQRERIRRQMARRRMLRRAGRWGVGGAVVLGVAAAVFFAGRPKPLTGQAAALVRRGDRAITAAGCTRVTTVRPYPGNSDRNHINPSEEPALSTYPSVPPASGPHLSTTQSSGVYAETPDVYPVIHSLEHGAAVIWYDPKAESNPQIQRIKDFFGDPANSDHVIVAPYNYPNQGEAGRLPNGKLMVLTAWHHEQTCAQPNFDVARAFVVQYAANGKGAYRGDAPEAGGQI